MPATAIHAAKRALHGNGPLRLRYATDWIYSLQNDKTQNKPLDYDGITNTYDWFLKVGPVVNIDKNYFKESVPPATRLLPRPFRATKSPLNRNGEN